jgi:hypothetical protein
VGAASSEPSAVKAPVIVTQPDDQQVLAGQTAYFSVRALGSGPLRYQWAKNGVAVPGATTMSYSVSPTTITDDGMRLNVVVSNSWGATTSLAATLAVNRPGQLNIGAVSLNFGNVPVGSSKTLSVTLSASGGSAVTVSSVGVSGSGFNVSGIPAGLILGPGQNATLNVSFTPMATQRAIGSVPIASNGSGSPTVISLAGSGVQPISYSVAINWVASSGAVVAYHVYRATTSGGPYGRLEPAVYSGTSFTDSSVSPGSQYYYVLTSSNSSGVESKYSSEVAAAIPLP